jgi:hypothetical protein
MKKLIVLVAMLSVDCVQGTDAIEYFKNQQWFNLVSVTPTNVTLKFHSSGGGLWISGSDFRKCRLLEYDEVFSLPQGQETLLTDRRHFALYITPVSFTDERTGFRVLEEFNLNSFGQGVTTNTMYLVLGDTPTPAGEDDVDMILVAKRDSDGYPTNEGEWKKFERGAKEPPPVPRPVQPPVQEEAPKPPAVTPTEPAVEQAPVIEDGPPAAIVEDGQPSEEPSKANYLWLYVLIPLGLLAALYFLRRKPTS